ncbi:MAG: pheromone processing endoprotease [Geoglossum umbratile]|nr:MAG: pheromone processing endoprotease [Geoglossum umbratile]
MRGLSAFGLLALLSSVGASYLRVRNYETHDYYAVHLDSSTSPALVAASLGLEYEGPLGELPDHYIFSSSQHEGDIVQEVRQRKRKRHAGADVLDSILFSQKQKLKPRMQKRGLVPEFKRHGAPPPIPPVTDVVAVDSTIARQREIARALNIQDPIFAEQWHLFNPVQYGHDVNVSDVWLQGITGHGSTVAIVDDGLDMYSDDLKDNYFAEGSYDFNDKDPEPKPVLSDDRHGTRCAGEVAAVKNNVCGVGVAYDSKVAGIRILSAAILDADEAIAMNYAFQKNQIYSCSWGPPDDGQAMDAPGILIKRAMLNGVQNGRGGKGSIYVFASGNGAGRGDNCNFDGYTNSIYSITIGAIDRQGLSPYYSERCCAQMVVTYSSGSGDAIHTTDVGQNSCSSTHGGTSAAAPLAAGIFALVLSVRPDLSWRDLQYLTQQTAVPVDIDDGSWQPTWAGKNYSHKFGYGKLDTYAIVEAAKEFKSVKPQAWYYSPWLHVQHPIPEGDVGLVSKVEVTKEDLEKANLERLEHVTVTMNVAHAKRGDLSVDLISPNGVLSRLSEMRIHDESALGYVDWTFMSVTHWGESGVGNWTVVVKDTVVNGFNGTFINWKLNLWGESIDPEKAVLLPMPTEHDDDDNGDVPGATTTVPVATTSIEIPSAPAGTVSVPTDHIDRPTRPNPSATSATTSSPPAASTTASSEENLLPSFFPTFGVSKRTQIWIYGSLVIVIIFCAGLGTYFYLARRKRLQKSSLDAYEFEALDDQEDLEDITEDAGAMGARTGRRRKGGRRAGELYDAFASGDSDEDVFSGDEEEKEYRDDVRDEAEGVDGSNGEKGPTEEGEARERLLGRR